MKFLNLSILSLIFLVSSIFSKIVAQSIDSLTVNQQHLVKISAFTAVGDLINLEKSLNDGLDASLTITEIRESLVHLYAYCGFPRSIRGLQTFIKVLEERKAKGINDKQGNEASAIVKEGSKYYRGKAILRELTKANQDGPLTGYTAFAPVIDTFLKEHLFADIFERDVLTFAQRELVTISVLSAIGGVEPMLKSHILICLNLGFTPQQLNHFIAVIELTQGKEKSNAANVLLREVLKG
jgi:alkylhydroperoxidase/carboxymuconolactone decarboxylase family protein YurZ